MKKLSAKEKDQVESDGGYPYHLVKCTVEWFPYNTTSGKQIEIKDSRLSYLEVREKAPQLLCDFFERHMQFV